MFLRPCFSCSAGGSVYITLEKVPALERLQRLGFISLFLGASMLGAFLQESSVDLRRVARRLGHYKDKVKNLLSFLSICFWHHRPIHLWDNPSSLYSNSSSSWFRLYWLHYGLTESRQVIPLLRKCPHWCFTWRPWLDKHFVRSWHIKLILKELAEGSFYLWLNSLVKKSPRTELGKDNQDTERMTVTSWLKRLNP